MATRKSIRAVPTDILDFRARVVVTPTGARIVPEELSDVSETADDHPHEDHVPPAATL
jgi:hypothetical protein